MFSVTAFWLFFANNFFTFDQYDFVLFHDVAIRRSEHGTTKTARSSRRNVEETDGKAWRGTRYGQEYAWHMNRGMHDAWTGVCMTPEQGYAWHMNRGMYCIELLRQKAFLVEYDTHGDVVYKCGVGVICWSCKAKSVICVCVTYTGNSQWKETAWRSEKDRRSTAETRGSATAIGAAERATGETARNDHVSQRVWSWTSLVVSWVEELCNV